MLDLIPLAGARWEMTNRYDKTGFVGELLQLDRPESNSRPVAASTVSGNQKATRLRISLPSHGNPPLADALHGKRCSVVVRSYIDTSCMTGLVVNPVGGHFFKFGNLKIVDTDFFRVALRSQLPSTVPEVTHPFPLLCIHRNNGLAARLKLLDLPVNILKLGIPIRVRASLRSLSVCLQTTVYFVKELGNHPVAGLMSHFLQFIHKIAHTPGRPSQWRFRVSPGGGFNEPFQVTSKCFVNFDGTLSSSACRVGVASR